MKLIRAFGRCVVTALVLPLAACMGEGSPPADFDPVPMTPQPQPPTQCPELAGISVDLAGSTLADAIVERKPPDTHGLPIYLSFRRGVTHQELWWTVPREALQAFARDLEQRSPSRYARWRELVLRGKLQGSREWDFDGWLAEVAELGPPGPVYAGMVSYACADHWTRARDQPSGPSSEHEIWLARDRNGDLLVKHLSFSVKHYSGWGGSSNTLRTGVSARWERVRAAPSVSAERLAEADLPPASAQALGSGPSNCAALPDRMVGFSQRILAGLPAGITMSFFQPQPSPAGSERDCREVIIELAFEGPDVNALTAVDTLLRDDPEVRNLDQLPSAAGSRRPERRLRAVLR